MSDFLLEALTTFFSLSILAITVQNTVFSRALSISRLLTLVDDTTSTGIFGGMLICVSVAGGLMNWFANRLLVALLPYPALFRPLAMILCMAIAYLLVFAVTVKTAPYDKIRRAVDALPGATFNCTVIGALLLSVSMQLDLYETVCYAFGAAVGYLFAITLVTEGQRKIQTENTPIAFRGLPVTLLYLAGLALAVYGLSGYSFAF